MLSLCTTRLSFPNIARYHVSLDIARFLNVAHGPGCGRARSVDIFQIFGFASRHAISRNFCVLYGL